MEFKQVIVLRRDLDLSKGKSCAQCCHASLEAFRTANPGARKKWLDEGQKKVVLYAPDMNQLIALKEKAKKLKIAFAIISDAGRTEVEPGTITCLALGPAPEKEIDKITGSLPLCE